MRRSVQLLLVSVLVLLAGCVNPPDSGPIRAGLAGPVPDVPQPLVRAIANPPRPGMQPTEIVAGFLDAAAAVGDGFAVARLYLAPQAAASWDPGARVTVTDTEVPDLSQAANSVQVRFVEVATISSSGVLTEQEPVSAAVDVAVDRIDGQWRITEAPQGLLLSRAEVGRAFSARNAYFVDPAGRWAVPDVRMVPLTGAEAQATALVRALLAGPSPWLAESVQTAIPGGLQLALGAVPVSGGVARVELSGPQPTLDAPAAQQFGAQFAWTLRQVAQVEAFVVTVDGREVQFGDQRGPVRLEQYLSFAPDVLAGEAALYGLDRAAAPVRLDGDTAAPAGAFGADPLAALAVSPTGTVAAAATADRSALLVGRTGTGWTQRIAEQVRSGPAVDGLDRVWWTDGAGQVRVAVPAPEGGYQTLTVALSGTGGPVTLVRPARDGTRALVVSGSAAYLAAVVATPSAIEMRGPRRLGDADGVADAAWHSADRVTVLLPGADVLQRLDLFGGSVGAFAVPPGAQSITDAPGVPVVLGLSDGTAGRITGSGLRLIDGLRAPAYPG